MVFVSDQLGLGPPASQARSLRRNKTESAAQTVHSVQYSHNKDRGIGRNKEWKWFERTEIRYWISLFVSYIISTKIRPNFSVLISQFYIK